MEGRVQRRCGGGIRSDEARVKYSGTHPRGQRKSSWQFFAARCSTRRIPSPRASAKGGAGEFAKPSSGADTAETVPTPPRGGELRVGDSKARFPLTRACNSAFLRLTTVGTTRFRGFLLRKNGGAVLFRCRAWRCT